MDVERRHDSVDVDVPRIHGYPSILRSEHSACLQVSRSARLVKRSIHLIQTQKKVPPTEKRGARKDKTIRMQFTYCVSLVTPLSYDNHVLQSPIPLGSCSVFSRQCSSESRNFFGPGSSMFVVPVREITMMQTVFLKTCYESCVCIGPSHILRFP